MRAGSNGLIVFGLCLGAIVPTIAAEAPSTIRPGDTIRAEMPFGDPFETSARFNLVAEEAGPLTIEARSNEFDIDLKVLRVGSGGESETIAEDGDAGAGPNSLLVIEAETGARYVIEVQPAEFAYCGGKYELAVSRGETEPVDAQAQQQADLAYFDNLLASVERMEKDECHVRALQGKATLLTAQAAYADAKALADEGREIAEKELGPEHYLAAKMMNQIGEILWYMGSYPEAKPLFERALAITEGQLGSDHPYVASLTNNLAIILFSMGDYPNSKKYYERALAIREKRLEPDHPDLATTLNSMAVVLQRMGSYDEARQCYERALRIYEKRYGPNHVDIAITLHNLATLLEVIGSYAEARPVYERALATFEKTVGPDHPHVALCLSGLGRANQTMGNYAQAKLLQERSLGIIEKAVGPDHPNVALSLNNLGSVLEDMGAYAEAKQRYERAIRIREKQLGPEHEDLAVTINNLAGVLQRMGANAEAKSTYEKSLAIFEKALGPEHQHVATNLINIARIDLVMGSHSEAKLLLERALLIYEKQVGADHPRVASTLMHLAKVYEDSGSLAEAKPYFERALAIREKQFGPDHPHVALSLSSLGRLLAKSGETGASLDAVLRAEQIGREHLRLTSRTLSERQALQFASVRAAGLHVALSILGQGLEEDPRAIRAVWDAVVRSRAIVLDEMAGRHHAVVRASDPEIVQLAEEVSLASSRVANLAVRGPGSLPLDQYRDMLSHVRREKEQAEQTLARKSVSFREELAKTTMGLQDVFEKLPPGSSLISFVRYHQYPLTNRQTKAPSLDRMNASKGSGAGQEEPVPSYLAFVLRSRDAEPLAVPLGRAKEIESLISRWQNEVGRGVHVEGRSEAVALAAYRDVGAALRHKIWDPIAKHLGKARRVFFVPDGALNLVNLVALPVGEANFLLEKGPLLHSISAERDLGLAGRGGERGEGLLAMGGPAFDETSFFASLGRKRREAGEMEHPGTVPTKTPVVITRLTESSSFRGRRSACGQFQDVRFEPLPASAEEVSEVASLWRKATSSTAPVALGTAGGSQKRSDEVVQLTGAGASEMAFRAKAPGKRVLHLATHAFFLGGKCPSALEATRGIGGIAVVESKASPPPSGDNPLLLSGLALAGANHRAAAAAEEDDGILTAGEIAAMDLSSVQWAVLSACDTGVGEVKAGEGVFGLRRAFQVAGAGTLIMSLWEVEDEAAREWMKALYESRFVKGLDTAEAVREASLRILRQRRQVRGNVHPFYWAAFVAAGDWR